MRHFIFLFICLFLIVSCKALHRGIPKSDDSYQKKKVTAVRESKQEVSIAKVSSDSISPQAVEKISSPESSSIQSTEEDAISTIENQDLTTVIDDTIRKPALSGNEIRAQEEESLEAAKNAYYLSFLPILPIGLTFLIGVIGTFVMIKRFKSYDHVTEEGRDYVRRAKRTLLFTSLIIPILTIIVLIILLYIYL